MTVTTASPSSASAQRDAENYQPDGNVAHPQCGGPVPTWLSLDRTTSQARCSALAPCQSVSWNLRTSAMAVLFLASDEARYITSAVLPVDPSCRSRDDPQMRRGGARNGKVVTSRSNQSARLSIEAARLCDTASLTGDEEPACLQLADQRHVGQVVGRGLIGEALTVDVEQQRVLAVEEGHLVAQHRIVQRHPGSREVNRRIQPPACLTCRQRRVRA
jgi:hypothetical protein